MTGTVSLSLSSAADLDLVVMASGAGGGCEPRNPGCIAASSNAVTVNSGTEMATFPVSAGQTYWVVVEGYGAAAGDYTLSTTCQ